MNRTRSSTLPKGLELWLAGEVFVTHGMICGIRRYLRAGQGQPNNGMHPTANSAAFIRENLKG